MFEDFYLERHAQAFQLLGFLSGGSSGRQNFIRTCTILRHGHLGCCENYWGSSLSYLGFLLLLWVSFTGKLSATSAISQNKAQHESKPEGALSSARLWQNCKYEHFGCERQKETSKSGFRNEWDRTQRQSCEISSVELEVQAFKFDSG